MSLIAPIPEEESQHKENRLASFYQNILDAQTEARHVEQVRESAASEQPSDEERKDDPSQNRSRQDPPVVVQLRAETDPLAEAPVYTRRQIINQYQETTTSEGPQTTEKAVASGTLDEADQELIRRLRARDAEVRQHEMRHVAALGRYAGAVQFHYQIGPDGRAYAIGGSTEVKATGPSDPASTTERSRQIRQAAMAGGDPSNADMAVALSATQSEQAAMAKKTSGQA